MSPQARFSNEPGLMISFDPAMKLFSLAGSLSSALFVSDIFLYKNSSPTRTHSLQFFSNQVYHKSSSSVSARLICCVSVERHLIQRLCDFCSSLGHSDDQQVDGWDLLSSLSLSQLWKRQLQFRPYLYFSCPLLLFVTGYFLFFVFGRG